MLKLRRLRIERFRNVEPGTELRFSDGLNVLLGQNGTGKTTLLELLSSLVRSDFSALQGEEFSFEYELLVDEATIVVALRNERHEVTPTRIPSLLGKDAFHPTMEARVQRGETRRALQFDNGRLEVDGRPVESIEMGSLLGPMALHTLLTVHGLSGLMSPFFSNSETVRFDESLDLFRSIMQSSQALRASERRDDPSAAAAFLTDGGSSGPVPKALFSAIIGLLQTRPTASRFSLSDSELPFLATSAKTMGFASAQAHVDVLARRGQSVEIGNLTFQFQYDEGGDMIFHERLSYGQKRLLTFFCYLDMCPDVVIADELVNGLHHAWIAAAMESIGPRQAFLTSQNPLLLDYLPLTSPEQVRSSFIFCRSERRDGQPRWRWENMSSEDATELFGAYEIGIEHVSEILQSRGLW